MDIEFEPGPVRPQRALARLGTAVSIASPIALLVIAVAIARVDPAPLSIVARPSGAPWASPGTFASAHTVTPPTAAAMPTSAFGLPVRNVDEILQARLEGELREGLAAVSGFLSIDVSSLDCSTIPDSDSDSLCGRTGSLSVASIGQAGASGARFEARFPPGVPLAAMLGLPWSGAGRLLASVPVVIIGRFGSGDPLCLSAASRCETSFIVERLAWAAGQWRERIVVIDPSLPAATSIPLRLAQEFAAREADRSESILSEAYVRLGVLHVIDPVAAGAPNPEPAGPVWYLRSAANPRFGDGQRLVSWVVFDDRTGLILATGPEATD